MINKGITVFCVFLFTAGLVSGRSQQSNINIIDGISGSSDDVIMMYDPDKADVPLDSIFTWPQYLASHRNNRFATGISCYGEIGSRTHGHTTPFDTFPVVGFENPLGSKVEYLFIGSPWVGGIVNNDTIVSYGSSGWTGFRELAPANYRDSGSIKPQKHIAHQTFRYICTDTTSVKSPQDFDRSINENMNIELTMLSHSWDEELYDHGVVLDIRITNFGGQPIEEGYFGYLVDGDIGIFHYMHPYVDDFVGSIKSHQIGYMVDNNGDFNPNRSPLPAPHAVASSILYSSTPLNNTNFNWSCLDHRRDFSPRKKSTPDDPYREYYNSLGSGHPVIDEDKYYVLSHSEWDYDQVDLGTITPEDSIWMMPDDTLTHVLMNGFDGRFILSTGPFELLPDSTIRFLVTIYLTKDVVSNGIMNFLPDNVDRYKELLNTQAIIDNLSFMNEKAEELLNPNCPVTGLDVQTTIENSIQLSCDSWVSGEVDGFTGYAGILDEVPATAMPYPGLIPPWHVPDLPYDFQLEMTTPRIDVSKEVMKSESVYAAGMVHTTASGYGLMGNWEQVSVFDPTAPEFTNQYAFFKLYQDAVISWDYVPDQNIDHFNIYRADHIDKAGLIHKPFYDTGYKKLLISPKDSFLVDDRWYFYYASEPVAEVAADERDFIVEDPSFHEAFVVAAVNKNGEISDFSQPIELIRTFPASKDILVICNGSNTRLNINLPEEVIGFYKQILDGFSYDIYSITDTLKLYGCDSRDYDCFFYDELSRYTLIIIDDTYRNRGLTKNHEAYNQDFTKYLQQGGILAYFGNLGGFYWNWNGYDSKIVEDEFIKQFFGISQYHNYLFTYYAGNDLSPFDTVFGFTMAENAYLSVDIPFDSLSMQRKWVDTLLWSNFSPPNGVFSLQMTVEP